MPSPDEISGIIGGWFTGDIAGGIIQGFIWVLILAIFAAIFFAVYMYIVHKYKITILQVGGSGSKESPYAIGRIKSDYAKENKDGSWQLLFKRKEIEPVDAKYVYSRNKVYLFDINGELVPGEVKLSEDKEFNIKPVPFATKKKVELELQKVAQSFAKQDFWSLNRQFIWLVVGLAIVVVFAGFVIWLAFKKTDQLIPALQNFGEVVKNINTIPGKG